MSADLKTKLSQLKELYELGLLTEDDFSEQKRALLAAAMGTARAAPQSRPAELLSGSTEVAAAGSVDMLLAGPTAIEGPSALPSRLGSYRVLGVIGAGGMGTVVRARHHSEGWARQQGGDVAIKLIHPFIASDSDFQARFFAEAALGRRVQHPGLVKVYDVVADGPWLGTILEYVEGRELSEWVRPGGLALEPVLELLAPLADALDHLHGLGIVHRDLKPANVKVRADGQPVLLDLGIAKDLSGEASSHTKTMMSMGTSAWMAPEQADAKSVTAAADVYALGLLAYALLSGRMPWAQGATEHRIMAHKMMGRLRPLDAGGKRVADVVMGALAVEPAAHPASCGALVRAMRSTEAAQVAPPASGTPKSSASPRATKARERRRATGVEAPSTGVPQAERGPVLRSPFGGTFLLARSDSEPLLVRPGDRVRAGQTLCIIETMGLMNEILAQFGGVVAEILVNEGRSVRQGQPLFRFEGGSVGQATGARPVGRQQHDTSSVQPFPRVQRIPDAAGAWEDFSVGEVSFRLRGLKAGTYAVGSRVAGKGVNPDERPWHAVRLSRAYGLGEHPVTQQLWKAVMGTNPSHFCTPVPLPLSGSRRPVESVSWLDAVSFCNRLSERCGLTPAYRVKRGGVTCDFGAPGFRLPTEHEWEVAARAQTDHLWSGGDKARGLAWSKENARAKTHPVGQKAANSWGLLDLSGNVWEWCWDRYSAGAYKHGTMDDPTGSPSGSYRVRRGGSWKLSSSFARVTYRSFEVSSYRKPDTGLRLSRTLA